MSIMAKTTINWLYFRDSDAGKVSAELTMITLWQIVAYWCANGNNGSSCIIINWCGGEEKETRRNTLVGHAHSEESYLINIINTVYPITICSNNRCHWTEKDVKRVALIDPENETNNSRGEIVGTTVTIIGQDWENITNWRVDWRIRYIVTRCNKHHFFHVMQCDANNLQKCHDLQIFLIWQICEPMSIVLIWQINLPNCNDPMNLHTDCADQTNL